jgi:hypothetical protein
LIVTAYVLHQPGSRGTWNGIEKCSHDEVGSLRVFDRKQDALDYAEFQGMPLYMKPWKITLEVPNVGDEAKQAHCDEREALYHKMMEHDLDGGEAVSAAIEDLKNPEASCDLCKSRTFTFEVNEYQLQVLRQALDNYARMGMGQLNVSVEEFLRQHFYDDSWSQPLDPAYERITKGFKVKYLVNQIKMLVFGHPPNGSWGIYNKQVPKACREAYDIRQIVGRVLSRLHMDRGDKGAAWTVYNRSYLATNSEDPPVKITHQLGGTMPEGED